MASIRSCTLAFAGVALLLGSSACSSRSYYGPVSGDGGAPPSTSNLPEISADKLGGKCSGGTSIGDTVAITSDRCEGGLCLIDARSGLEIYCSADCSNARCPEGYLCESTTVSPKKVCFKDPNGTEPPKTGADAGVTADYRDTKLTGYREEFTTSMKLSLRDFGDATRKDVDLVVLMMSSAWDVNSNNLLAKGATSFDRVRFVSVLVEGASVGKPANNSDVIAWRNKHPGFNMLLDPGLTTLRPTVANDLTAFPTFVALDAKTLARVGDEWTGTADLGAEIDQRR